MLISRAPVRPPCRPRCGVAATALLLAGAIAATVALAAAAGIPIAAFSTLAPGAALPQGWEPFGFENIKNRTQYSLVDDDGRTVVRAEAQSSASGLIRKIRLDPRDYPVVRWSWKISNTLPGADLSRKDGDDFPARIYVMFDYPSEKLSFTERVKVGLARLVYGEALPLATLCYVWASREPAGTIAPSAYTDRVRIIVVESGEARAGRWVGFERNLARDFEAAFGEPPPAVTAFAIATDTDNTGGRVTAHFGDISVSKQ